MQKKMYTKPEIIAKNIPQGSYSAGCPVKNTGDDNCLLFENAGNGCHNCERAK